HSLAVHRIADHHRNDVARIVHHRHAGVDELSLQRQHALLYAHPFDIAHLEVADAGERAGDDGRRERGGEDEAWGIRADGVAAGFTRGDVTAHHAETLGQRAVDDVDAVHYVVALGDAAAA